MSVVIKFVSTNNCLTIRRGKMEQLNGGVQGFFILKTFVCGFSVGAASMLPLVICVKHGCRCVETALLPKDAC
jgi:hypothetical protein